MTSNLRRTLGGMLTLAIVATAAEARAQSLEKPGAPPPEAAAAAPTGPASFGDGGQFVLSAERLFGYTYTHQSFGGGPAATSSSFTLLSSPFGDGSGAYDWPRLGFDYFLTRGISAGGSLSFFRASSGNSSQTGFEVAPRLGYAMMVGPWLGIWPRVGVTYVHSSNGGTTLQYLGLTLEAQLAFVIAPHLVILFGPTLDLGLSGSTANAGVSNSAKLTDVGAYFGLAVPF
jgi:hypothetical protein